jgi:glucose-1-phosphate thymidylyltransferase
LKQLSIQNKILLEKSPHKRRKLRSTNVKIIEPVSIHPSARVSNSTIGPYASIGANCKIENCQIADSILEADCEIKDSVLTRSIIGKQAIVKGRNDGHVMQLNIADDSSVIL